MLSGGDVYNNSIRYGGTGGAFMRYTLTDIFAVQPEVLFAMKGANYEAEGLKSQEKINYIEIPLLVRATMPNESKIKPSIFLGPAIGILLSNKITNGEEIDIKDATKSSEIGVIAGAGVEYMLEKGCVLVDARYEMGLSSIMKKREGEQREVKDRVISIMVGYGMKF
jgi:outer membrane protein W